MTYELKLQISNITCEKEAKDIQETISMVLCNNGYSGYVGLNKVEAKDFNKEQVDFILNLIHLAIKKVRKDIQKYDPWDKAIAGAEDVARLSEEIVKIFQKGNE